MVLASFIDCIQPSYRLMRTHKVSSTLNCLNPSIMSRKQISWDYYGQPETLKILSFNQKRDIVPLSLFIQCQYFI